MVPEMPTSAERGGVRSIRCNYPRAQAMTREIVLDWIAQPLTARRTYPRALAMRWKMLTPSAIERRTRPHVLCAFD